MTATSVTYARHPFTPCTADFCRRDAAAMMHCDVCKMPETDPRHRTPPPPPPMPEPSPLADRYANNRSDARLLAEDAAATLRKPNLYDSQIAHAQAAALASIALTLAFPQPGIVREGGTR